MTLSGIMSGTEDRTVFQSMKNHPRYHLRVTAIVAVALGLFFNTLAIIIAREYVLSGLAFLPVGTLPCINTPSTIKSWLTGTM